MSNSDSSSPLGLAAEVEKLLKLPQHLCKVRGNCCRIATFKGLLKWDALVELAKEDSQEGEMARDFKTLFVPYEDEKDVEKLSPEFYERLRAKAVEHGKDPENIGYYRCRFVLESGQCGVHEDRPGGCRAYPFPHKHTIYHPGCGFEQQGLENWRKIQKILTYLGMDA
jgi:Fe-S-cluster containining protein